MWYEYLRDLGGVLFSIASMLVVAVLTIRAFMLHDRPTNLHIAMHIGRRSQSQLRIKVPTLSRMVLPEIYDYITATWLLLFARRWARKSRHAPVLAIGRNGSWWGRIVGKLAPRPAYFLEPLRRFLSGQSFEAWVKRGREAGADGSGIETEAEFVVALVHEDGSPSVRAVVILRSLLERIADDPDCIGTEPHPRYAGAGSRPQTLKCLAAAFKEWLKSPGTSDLAITVLEM